MPALKAIALNCTLKRSGGETSSTDVMVGLIARHLREHDVDIRVFVLLGAPGIPEHESVDWAVRSAEYAAERGAGVVSIIPLRGGNGEMERLATLGRYTPPTLRQLEAALDRCVGWDRTVVTVDLWDVERLPGCTVCREQRVQRLRRMNVTGLLESPVDCDACDR